MAFRVEELTVYPKEDLQAALDAIGPGWTIRHVFDAQPLYLQGVPHKMVLTTDPSTGAPIQKMQIQAIFVFESAP